MPSRLRTADHLRSLTVALLLLVTVAAWADVVMRAHEMPMRAPSMSDGMLAEPEPLITATGLVAYVSSWVVMMAAMMLPSAAPMILLYQATARNRAAHGDAHVPTWIFALGYLAVWAAFGAAIYLAGRLLTHALSTAPGRARWAPYGVALVLVTAGVYQFTALKRVCLRACQHPLVFLLQHWKPDRSGAFRMGLAHGWYCTGCCWALMVVLVAAGAMGLAWVLLIALIVAAEKLLPQGQWTARFTGAMLLGLGILVAVQPQLAAALRGSRM